MHQVASLAASQLSPAYVALLPKLGELVGLPSHEVHALLDNLCVDSEGQCEKLEEGMETLVQQMTETVAAFEAKAQASPSRVVVGLVNDALEQDKKQPAKTAEDATSSLTTQEAKRAHLDTSEGLGNNSKAAGSGTIQTPHKIYHPPLMSQYQEPELGEDLNDGMDWLFMEHGK